MASEQIHPWRWRLLVIWIIVFTLATGYSIRVSRENTTQNKERIADIQQSRLDSCKTTYNSFHAVFDPFFPPPEKRTAKQKRDLAKLDRIIAAKIKKCRKQVTPPALPQTKGKVK